MQNWGLAALSQKNIPGQAGRQMIQQQFSSCQSGKERGKPKIQKDGFPHIHAKAHTSLIQIDSLSLSLSLSLPGICSNEWAITTQFYCQEQNQEMANKREKK